MQGRQGTLPPCVVRLGSIVVTPGKCVIHSHSTLLAEFLGSIKSIFHQTWNHKHARIFIFPPERSGASSTLTSFLTSDQWINNDHTMNLSEICSWAPWRCGSAPCADHLSTVARSTLPPWTSLAASSRNFKSQRWMPHLFWNAFKWSPCYHVWLQYGLVPHWQGSSLHTGKLTCLLNNSRS